MANFELTNTASQVDAAIQAVVDAPNNSVVANEAGLVSGATVRTAIDTTVANLPAANTTSATPVIADDNTTDGTVSVTAKTITLGNTTASPVIIKSGTFNIAGAGSGSGTDYTVTFATAFPNACFTVIVNNQSVNFNDGKVTSITASSFAFSKTQAQTNPSNHTFFAIGN